MSFLSTQDIQGHKNSMTGIVKDGTQPQGWEKEDSLAEKTVNYKNPDGILFLSDHICLEIWCHQLSKRRKRHAPFVRCCEQMHADSPSVTLLWRWAEAEASLCLNFRNDHAVNYSVKDGDGRRWNELGSMEMSSRDVRCLYISHSALRLLGTL